MKRIISLVTITFQIVSAFVVLFFIYIIFALLDMNDFDMPAAIGFAIFQPVFGFILCCFTILTCIVLGLPIRFIPRLHNWLSARPLIIVIGVCSGFILLLLSLNSTFTDTTKFQIDGAERTKAIPNFAFASIGWFLTAFSLLHFYPGALVKLIVKRISSKAKT